MRLTINLYYLNIIKFISLEFISLEFLLKFNY